MQHGNSHGRGGQGRSQAASAPSSRSQSQSHSLNHNHNHNHSHNHNHLGASVNSTQGPGLYMPHPPQSQPQPQPQPQSQAQGHYAPGQSAPLGSVPPAVHPYVDYPHVQEELLAPQSVSAPIPSRQFIRVSVSVGIDDADALGSSPFIVPIFTGESILTLKNEILTRCLRMPTGIRITQILPEKDQRPACWLVHRDLGELNDKDCVADVCRDNDHMLAIFNKKENIPMCAARVGKGITYSVVQSSSVIKQHPHGFHH
eukprot:TRINITY_DN364_c0_g1_i4.p1 TRINITY_DN364_c0_g1~~TRINITY_DN364_c0_g1_i4.p1  ORF type:complete len:257 (-),score=34.09 TRINITY_DN364_c0_g1_i4:312-1082(-)